MTRCIIHIGMHKTGSTSIQRSLKAFSDERFLYPTLGGFANHSLAVYSAFSDHPEQYFVHSVMGRDTHAVQQIVDQVREDLERAVLEAIGRTLIISGEDIASLRCAELIKLREYLQDRFDEIVVVGYVRAQGEFMASAFQQRLRTNIAMTLDLRRTYRSYRARFDNVDRVFGCENVSLWKFDPQVFPENCVVRDFCRRLGIDLPRDRIVRLNRSLSRQAVALLYTYRKLGEIYGSKNMNGAETNALGNLLAAVGDDKFRFSPNLLGPVLEENRADIEWMEARVGESLQEQLGEPRPGDVCSESDLLTPHPEVVSKLLQLIGDAAPQGVEGRTPQEVALLVHTLREQRRGQLLRRV